MKRDPALTSLSRDHHQALVVAQQLRRAAAESAGAARTAFLAYWEGHGRGHFRLEEEVLLPAYAAHGDPHHPLVGRTLCDHVDIRHRADALARDPAAPIAALHELGACLADHVRLEERELFPLIEHAMPAAQLAAVAFSLEQADRAGVAFNPRRVAPCAGS
jgi:Hemerythrin HHE cation binding domain